MKRLLLYAGEIAGIASIVAGATLIYLPAGLILGGVLMVVGFERAMAKGAAK